MGSPTRRAACDRSAGLYDLAFQGDDPAPTGGPREPKRDVQILRNQDSSKETLDYWTMAFLEPDQFARPPEDALLAARAEKLFR
jgi:hypothetical protein